MKILFVIRNISDGGVGKKLARSFYMTNNYIEYARAMKYIENHGHDFRERLRILNEFTQTSKFYKFNS